MNFGVDLILQLNPQSLQFNSNPKSVRTVPRARTRAWLSHLTWSNRLTAPSGSGAGDLLWAVGFASHGPPLHTPSRGRVYRSRWIGIGWLSVVVLLRPSRSLAHSQSHGREWVAPRRVASGSRQRASAAHLMRLRAPPSQVQGSPAPVPLRAPLAVKEPDGFLPLLSVVLAT